MAAAIDCDKSLHRPEESIQAMDVLEQKRDVGIVIAVTTVSACVGEYLIQKLKYVRKLR